MENAEDNLEAKSNRILFFCATLVLVIVISSSVIQSYTRADGCSSHLNDGFVAANGLWYPNWCILHQYKKQDFPQCFKKWDHVMVIGGDKAKEYSAIIGDGSKNIEFKLYPEVNSGAIEEYRQLASQWKASESILILHKPQAYLFKGRRTCDEVLSTLISAQRMLLDTIQHSLVVFFSPEYSREALDDSCRLTAQKVYSNLSLPASLVFLDVPVLQLHNSVSQELNLVLNAVCSSRENATCCVDGKDVHFTVQLMTPLLITVLALYLGFYLVFVSGATFALTPHLEARGFNMDRFFSILHSIGSTAALLLYLQMADKLDYFSKASFVPHQLLCVCLVVGVIALAYFTLKDTDQVEVLSRDQCQEWRGFLMILLILVNYCAVEEARSLVFNIVSAGFLFLSGYCHFNNFWNKENIPWKQSILVLFRLNFLPLLVCVALGASYGAYSLLLLLSLSFLLVFFFMVSWPPGRVHGSAIGVKFFVLLVFLVLFPLLKNPIKNVFRLDFHLIETQRFNPFLGMLAAYGLIVVKSKYRSLVHQYQYRLRLLAIASALVMILCYAILLLHFQSSGIQVQLGILPVLSLVILRNGLYPHYCFTSSFLRETGIVSTWLYVCHYHILLTFNGKGLLMLFPQSPFINIVLVTTTFVAIFVLINTSLHTCKNYF